MEIAPHRPTGFRPLTEAGNRVSLVRIAERDRSVAEIATAVMDPSTRDPSHFMEKPSRKRDPIYCKRRKFNGDEKTVLVIDRQKKQVTFRNCFSPSKRAFFSWPTVSEHVCSFSDVLQVESDGDSSLLIITTHGKARIDKFCSNTHEARAVLERVAKDTASPPFWIRNHRLAALLIFVVLCVASALMIAVLNWLTG